MQLYAVVSLLACTFIHAHSAVHHQRPTPTESAKTADHVAHDLKHHQPTGTESATRPGQGVQAFVNVNLRIGPLPMDLLGAGLGGGIFGPSTNATASLNATAPVNGTAVNATTNAQPQSRAARRRANKAALAANATGTAQAKPNAGSISVPAPMPQGKATGRGRGAHQGAHAAAGQAKPDAAAAHKPGLYQAYTDDRLKDLIHVDEDKRKNMGFEAEAVLIHRLGADVDPARKERFEREVKRRQDLLANKKAAPQGAAQKAQQAVAQKTEQVKKQVQNVLGRFGRGGRR